MPLFLAISPDLEARTALARASDRVRAFALPATRLVATEKLHVTLRFLGEIDEARVASLVDAYREAVRAFAPLALQVRGAGAFPDARRAKVIWLGVQGGVEALHALERRLTEAALRCGIEPEERELQPHVTLAYVKQAINVMPLLAALDTALAPVPLRVTELVLMRSRTQQGGSVYEVLASFPLSAGARESP